MSNRQKNSLLCLGALMLGAVVYILFRPNTWVSHLFDGIEFIVDLRSAVASPSRNWFRYYVPDLLWAFALCCGIQAIYEPEHKGVLFCALTALCCGVVWEMLQWSRIVTGTGDVWDILMYLTGSVLSILINVKGEKQT